MIRNLWANWKTELLVGAMGLCYKVAESLNWVTLPLGEYLSEDRLSYLLSFLSIISGIYIAVLAIFATSVTRITVQIVKDNREKQLLTLLTACLGESMLLILTVVFVPVVFPVFTLCLTVLAVLSLLKFLWLLLATLRLNLEELPREIDAENLRQQELLRLLLEISKNSRHIGE